MTPVYCIERNHPTWVTELPSIECNGQRFIGLYACITFYECMTGIHDLHAKAIQFKQEQPNFRIYP